MVQMMNGLSDSLHRVQDLAVYLAGVGMERRWWLLFELMEN